MSPLARKRTGVTESKRRRRRGKGGGGGQRSVADVWTEVAQLDIALIVTSLKITLPQAPKRSRSRCPLSSSFARKSQSAMWWWGASERQREIKLSSRRERQPPVLAHVGPTAGLQWHVVVLCSSFLLARARLLSRFSPCVYARLFSFSVALSSRVSRARYG